MKNVFHLSHVDLDGYGCQALMEGYLTSISKYKDIKYKFYNSNYGDEILEKLETLINNEIVGKSKEELEETLVLITDLNLTEEAAAFIDSQKKKYGFKLILLDHHKSGESVSKNYDWYYLTEGKSGTLLTYEFIKSDYLVEDDLNPELNEEIERFVLKNNYGVECINTYDLWKQSEEFNFVIGSNLSFYLNMIGSFFNRGEMEELHNKIVRSFLRRNINLLRVSLNCYGQDKDFGLEKMTKDLHNSIFECIIGYIDRDREDFKMEDRTLSGAISKLKVDFYVSELERKASNMVLVEELNNEIVIIYTKNSISSLTLNGIISKLNLEYGTKAILSCNSSGIISCRSLGDFDVSSLAKHYGGGGHLNASGFQIDIKEIKSKVEKVIEDKGAKDKLYKEKFTEVAILEDLKNKVILYFAEK